MSSFVLVAIAVCGFVGLGASALALLVLHEIRDHGLK